MVTLHEGSLSPRVASWLLRNTSIDAAHAVQLASDVRQQLVDHKRGGEASGAEREGDPGAGVAAWRG